MELTLLFEGFQMVSSSKGYIGDRGGSRGGLWGLETPPPPQHIREAKVMMCCYKST